MTTSSLPAPAVSTPLPSPELAPVAPRSPGLDAARALSVMAMVFGHTAEALLSTEARALPWVQTYWAYRGLTAPIFLFVSGWAVLASMNRSALSGGPLLRRHFRRVVLLFGIGLFLRLPTWDIPGLFRLDPAIWSHWLGFDALQCIALSLLLGVAAMAWVPSWKARGVLLMALITFVLLSGGAAAAFAAKPWVPLAARTLLRADSYSPFPLFPWAAYFFAGALVGTSLGALEKWKVHVRWGTAAMGVLGLGLIGLSLKLGMSNLSNVSPVLFSYRLGHVLIIAAGTLLLPVKWSSALGPIGRSSLAVYVAHLPLVYGWAFFPGLRVIIGRVLNPLEVLFLAIALLIFGLYVARVIRLKPWRRYFTRYSAAPAVLPR